MLCHNTAVPDTDSLVAAAGRLLDHHRRSVSTGEDIRSPESDIRAAIRDLFAVSDATGTYVFTTRHNMRRLAVGDRMNTTVNATCTNRRLRFEGFPARTIVKALT